ncbi:hypothetical protein F945_01721, partial [Acinetobacter rudis CIP 110305]
MTSIVNLYLKGETGIGESKFSIFWEKGAKHTHKV